MTSLPPDELVKHAMPLAQSKTVRTGLLWVLTVVVLPSAGWVVAKLDTQKDMAAIRESIVDLSNQQKDLLKRMDGSIPELHQRVNGVQRDVALAFVAARSYESEKYSRAKLAAADRIVGEVYDQQIKALTPPATAARVVFAGDVPYSR